MVNFARLRISAAILRAGLEVEDSLGSLEEAVRGLEGREGGGLCAAAG